MFTAAWPDLEYVVQTIVFRVADQVLPSLSSVPLISWANSLGGFAIPIGRVVWADLQFALVKLRYLSAWAHAEPAVLSRLDRLLEDMIEPETLLVYWTHWGLRMVDWTIQNGWPAAVELHLDVAGERLSFEPLGVACLNPWDQKR